MDLSSILWLALHCNGHGQAVVNPVSASAMPTNHGLVHTHSHSWCKALLAVTVEQLNEVINKFPATLLMGHFIRLCLRLVAETQAFPKLVKSVAGHTEAAKCWGYNELGVRFVGPKVTAIGKLKPCAKQDKAEE